MKKLISLLSLCVMQLAAHAQVPTTEPYPNVVAVATAINKYSFFVDSISNTNEQPLAFAAANSNTTAATPISLTGVASGVHQLYAKVTTTNGVASITNIGNFYIVDNSNFYANAPAAATAINKYSFFIDSVSTVNEQPLAFAAANSNTTAATPINLTGVASGVHQLYAKVTATNGVASITNIGNFYMEDNGNFYANAPLTATAINKYSFFVDSVSTVNEQPLAFAAANSNTTPSTPINLTGVNPGLHQLYAKVTATNGVASITNIGNFFMDNNFLYANAPAAAVPINRYEFFVDSVGNNNTQPLAFATALQHTTASTAINLAGVLPGAHNLYARVYDVNNVASITNIGPFAMEQVFRYTNTPIPAAPLQNMEYYIDTDPGYGLATPIAVSGTNTTEVFNNISVAIPNNLAGGTHFFHIRSKQNPWSIDNALPFQIGTVVPVTWLYVKAQLVANTTLLQWATASEANSKTYIIEWSTNGVSFAAIGNVIAAGNSSTTTTYNFTHSTPNHGYNYYRIKQLDADGSFKYSVIVKVLLQQIKLISIAPNPATNYIQLALSSTQKTLIQIFDTQGKLVSTQYSTNQPLLVINVSTFAKGSYIVQVSDGGILHTGSFLKQ